jgi:hypothetical protein
MHQRRRIRRIDLRGTRVLELSRKYHITILFENFNAKVRRQGIFKPKLGNDIFHEINNDNAVGVENFATSEIRQEHNVCKSQLS